MKLFGIQSFNIWKSWNLIELFCSAEAGIFSEFFFEGESFSRVGNLVFEFDKFSFGLIFVGGYFEFIFSILKELDIGIGIVFDFRFELIVLIKDGGIASSS